MKAEPPKALTLREKVERLNELGQKIDPALRDVLALQMEVLVDVAREGDRRLFDSIIETQAKKESTNQGIPTQPGQTPPVKAGLEQYVQTVRGFTDFLRDTGIMPKSGGENQLDALLGPDISKMLVRSVVTDLRKSVSARLGIPFHEVEGEHGF